jgi:hypothetical protein
MSIERGRESARPEPDGRPTVVHEERRVAAGSRLARGTLACPACDAPVAPLPRAMSPAEALDCPFCAHGAAVRDFLSLADPARPARVDVRVVRR